MTKNNLQAIRAALAAVTPDSRKQVLELLREEFPIHDLEKQWNVRAEVILEAIARSADLTKRGIRGVIAGASFNQYVVMPRLSKGWKDETPEGDIPFDFNLVDTTGPVRVQVKMQRLEKRVPKHWKSLPGYFVVETQKTRSGTDSSGEDTRPYRFGEFDVLAVSLHPSTGDWTKFAYTVADWLLPREDDVSRIAVFQPVCAVPNKDWCDDFDTVVTWFREKKKKKVSDPSGTDPIEGKKKKR